MAGLFLGIQVPYPAELEVRRQVNIASREVGVGSVASARVVHAMPHQMHSTLQFRGSEHMLPRLDVYAALCHTVQPFKLSMRKPYVFQSGRIAYLCADITGTMDRWRKLSVGTNPHITLARIETIAFEGTTLTHQQYPLNEIADRMCNWQGMSWTVSAVHLYKSTNGRYEIIDSYALKGLK